MVLLICGKSGTAQSIELIPKVEGFDAHTTDVGEEGADLGSFSDDDIILFDLRLPDMAGDEVLRTLRLSRINTPIMVLSGTPGIEDRFRGLGFGADDDMTKPFTKIHHPASQILARNTWRPSSLSLVRSPKAAMAPEPTRRTSQTWRRHEAGTASLKQIPGFD
ncbi:MAG: response regulator, partial [Pseudomonadota bacterium]|nr:response regulator [Pseudomonadota bacterium]